MNVNETQAGNHSDKRGFSVNPLEESMKTFHLLKKKLRFSLN